MKLRKHKKKWRKKMFKLLTNDPDYATIIELLNYALDEVSILDQMDLSDEEAFRLRARINEEKPSSTLCEFWGMRFR